MKNCLDENLTGKQRKLQNAFSAFVRSNTFIMASYGTVYFHLRESDFLDYLLKTDIVYMKDGVEIGVTKAKIFYELFYHLYLIPAPEIRLYLINNFPLSYSKFVAGVTPIVFSDVNYELNILDEVAFNEYKDYYRKY